MHLQCRRPWFDSWVRKIPWRRDRLSTPISWRKEFHGLHSPWGLQGSDMTDRLSLSHLRMIQPKWSMTPRMGNNGLCLAFLSLTSETIPVLIPHHSATQAFPTTAPPPHSAVPILSLTPDSPVTSSTRARAKKNLGTWPGSRAYMEKVPCNPWEMWFPITLSKVWLQAQAIQAVPTLAEERTFVDKYKLIPNTGHRVYFWEEGTQTKYLISKRSFSWVGPMKGCCWTTPRSRGSWPPEKNSIQGQRRGLIAQSFFVIKFS